MVHKPLFPLDMSHRTCVLRFPGRTTEGTTRAPHQSVLLGEEGQHLGLRGWGLLGFLPSGGALPLSPPPEGERDRALQPIRAHHQGGCVDSIQEGSGSLALKTSSNSASL